MACSQPVDDPAIFTAGNSQGNSAGSTAGETDGSTGNISATSNASVDGTGADATTTTTGVAESTTTGPTVMCGNGVIDPGEQCDGTELQGFDCMSLGLNGGTLACDAQMCTFDTSMCSSTTGGTSG